MIKSQVFSTSGSFAASSCGANALPQPVWSFDFPAAGLEVQMTCAGRVFYRLDGAVATTLDAYMTTTSPLQIYPPGFVSTGIGLTTTSTSTAAGGSPTYSVSAYASA